MKSITYMMAGKTGKLRIFPVFPVFRIAAGGAGKTGKKPIGFPRFPAPRCAAFFGGDF